MLSDEGYFKDIVAAVLDASAEIVPDVWNRAAALQDFRNQTEFEPLATAFKRVANIIRKSAPVETSAGIDPALFRHPSEEALFAALSAVQDKIFEEISQGEIRQAFRDIAALRPAVDDFFDGVLVNTEEKALRENRLSLLGQVASLFGALADFSRISV